MTAGVIVVSQEGRWPLHVLVLGRLDIGRECDGLLLADQRVSRLHLRLEMVDDAMVVADQGSSNGTFLDGMRIRSPVVLTPYSTVTLGSTSIRLHSLIRDRHHPSSLGASGDDTDHWPERVGAASTGHDGWEASGTISSSWPGDGWPSRG